MPAYKTKSGHLLLDSDVDCNALIDFILHTDYPEEFCLSLDFDPDFVDRLMQAGFLVMSTAIVSDDGEETKYLLMPKHHIIRSVLLFDELHIGKTIKRYLNQYELRAGVDFDKVVQNCIDTHGDDWLTSPLVDSIKEIRSNPLALTRPFSFALYKNNKLVAGEFGIVSGRVYTSYSGYHEENNSGRVQMILTAQYLHDNGFDFWDLGMPLDYKYSLGVRDLSTREFIKLFRNARYFKS